MSRVTLKLESPIHAVTWDVLVTELMPVFDLERDEVKALLLADSIVLEPETANAVMEVCDSLGITVAIQTMTPVSRPVWWRAALAACLLVAVVAVGLVGWRIFQEHDAQAVTFQSEPVPSTNSPAEAESPATTVSDTPTMDLPVVESLDSEVPDLFTAARDLGVTEVRESLVRAAGVDIRDMYGQTPLMYAAAHNTAFVVRELLMSGADVNALTDAAWTPLMYAVRNTQHPEVLEVLLSAGADPLLQNEDGETALLVAEREGGLTQRDMLEAVTVVEVPVPETAVRVIPVTPLPRQVAASARPVANRLPVSTADQQLRNLIITCINDWENCDGN
jgi:hypothetical protein